MASVSELKSQNVAIEAMHSYYGANFPCIVQNESPEATLDDTVAWAASRRSEFCAAAECSGAVLFRGFPLHTANDFDAFVSAFGLPNFAYADSLSNAVRINKTPRVFTANEAPPTATIVLHHEMAQTPLFPSKLFFFCEQPPESGGATPLCRSDALWERIATECPDFARKCIVKGLRYSHIMPADNDLKSGMGRSWRSTLKAETRVEAENRLRALNYAFEWLAGDELRATTPVLQAVWELPSKRKSFFNQLIAFYCGPNAGRVEASKSVTFGDGEPLDYDAVSKAGELSQQFTFDLNWQCGDVALVDNFVCMHGRRTFTGTRKVLASLVAHVTPIA